MKNLKVKHLETKREVKLVTNKGINKNNGKIWIIAFKIEKAKKNFPDFENILLYKRWHKKGNKHFSLELKLSKRFLNSFNLKFAIFCLIFQLKFWKSFIKSLSRNLLTMKKHKFSFWFLNVTNFKWEEKWVL